MSLRELDNWDIDEFSQYLAYLDMRAEIEAKILDTDNLENKPQINRNVVMDWEGNVLNG